jgi:hypothetical protein
MIDTLDRMLIAPLLGVVAYFLHATLFSTMFIWFAQSVKGGAFWLLLVLAQISAALIVGAAVALPLDYFYRSKTIQAGLIVGAMAAGIYGFLILTGPSRSTLNISLELLKMSWLIWLVPIIAYYGSRKVLPRVALMFQNRRADG